MVISFAAISCEDEQIIPAESILTNNTPTSNFVPDTTSTNIPASISEYVAVNFPGSEIRYVVKDVDDFETNYEVFLSTNFELEFNSTFNITEIKGFTKLPDSVIPAGILTYVNQHYSNSYIVQWELDNWHQQVELNNDLDLEFSLDGTFIGIDD